MKKIKNIIFAIILSMILPSIALGSEGDIQILWDLCKFLKVELELIEIVDWSLINRDFMTLEELDELTENILYFFKASPKNFKSMKEFDDRYRIINTEGLLDSDTLLHITIHSLKLPEEYEKKPQTYLSMRIEGQNKDKLVEYQEQIAKILVYLGGKSKTSTCVLTSINGKLDRVEKENLVNNFINFLNITNQKIMNDKSCTNIMGQSLYFPEGIIILKERFNVNLIMRYNEKDNKTYIWIGTPVISTEH